MAKGGNNNSQSINTASQLATLSANTQNMANDIADIKDDIKDLKGNYVTKDRFDPVEKVVYGLVALILLAVVGTVITLVLNHPLTVVSH